MILMQNIKLSRVAVFMLIVGTVYFASGLHAIDTAWNMNVVRSVTGQMLSDTSLGGSVFDMNEVYRNGLSMTYIGFFTSMLACLHIAFRHPYRAEKRKESFWKIVKTKF